MSSWRRSWISRRQAGAGREPGFWMVPEVTTTGFSAVPSRTAYPVARREGSRARRRTRGACQKGFDCRGKPAELGLTDKKWRLDY